MGWLEGAPDAVAEILGDRYHKLVPLPIIQTRARAAPAIAAPAILTPARSAPVISNTHMYPMDTLPSSQVTNRNIITIQSLVYKLARMLSTQATRLDRLIIK